MTDPEYPHRADGDSSSEPAEPADAGAAAPGAVDPEASSADPYPSADPSSSTDPSRTAEPGPVAERPLSRPTSGPIDPHDDDHPFDRTDYGSPTTAFRPGGEGSSPYRPNDSDATTVMATTPATTPAATPAVTDAPMTPPGAMPAWQSTPAGTPPGASAGSTSALQAEPGTFFGQPPRTAEPDIAPPKSRVWQNLLGAVGGLVLVLGPVILFAVLAGTPDSLFEQATGRRLVVLGLIVIAALPALVAGWAPAAAWLPGGVFALAGTIALFSQSFVDTLQRWSEDLFSTPVVGLFVATVGLYLGFALLFAGLGTVWARRSGVDSVLDRISPNP